MDHYVSLFKSVPVKTKSKTFSTDFLRYGALVEDSVVEEYSLPEIVHMLGNLVPTDWDINKSFHKSWGKVRDSSNEQLLTEQLLHYFTTYGFKNLGFHNEGTAYLPPEELHLKAEKNVVFYVLRGSTKNDLMRKVNRILTSPMALSEGDLDALCGVVNDLGISVDLQEVANRELAVMLAARLNLVPEDPVDFLRSVIYKKTGSTLLIKNSKLLQTLKDEVLSEDVFEPYKNKYGIARLSTVFYRMKPIFLALKNPVSASTVNRIRKLAKKWHEPMEEDVIASVTKNLRNGSFDIHTLREALEKTNVFRKVKLLQALRFYGNKDVSGVVYSVRNGSSFVTETEKIPQGLTKQALDLVENSLKDSVKHLKGKKFYMDVDLAAPNSGKKFLGDVPFGSSFTTEDSLVLGIYWENGNSGHVDLDLSIISAAGKIGWNGEYRNCDFLFSGDVVDAPSGASEAFLVRKGIRDGTYLLNLNFFAGNCKNVPFKVFVCKEDEFEVIKEKHIANQDNMIFWASSEISQCGKQKLIGVLKVRNGVKTFHVFESTSGLKTVSSVDEVATKTLSFYSLFLDSLVSLEEVINLGGGSVVSDPEESDVDLSMSLLTKESLLAVMEK